MGGLKVKHCCLSFRFFPPQDQQIPERTCLDVNIAQGVDGFVEDAVERTSSFVNDPSAGSPTETLLRLLLPLNGQVYPTSRFHVLLRIETNPKDSLSHSIGSSDGRCVQRAGT